MAETALCVCSAERPVVPELLTNVSYETFQKASHKLIIQVYKADLKSFFGSIPTYYIF